MDAGGDRRGGMPEKVAVITGGGSGIGRAVALGLAGAGYAVVVAGRRREPLEATTSDAAVSGARAFAMFADVRDRRRWGTCSRRSANRLAGSTCLYMASLPLDTNVLFMTLFATRMPFVGRG